jgi:hypothetical protein
VLQALIFPFRSNAFKRIVKDLPDAPKILTFTILDNTAKHLRKGGVRCKTYGEVIEVLEYLAEHNAIFLEPVADTQVYKIGKQKRD